MKRRSFLKFAAAGFIPLVSSSVENSAESTPLTSLPSVVETAVFAFMLSARPFANATRSLGFNASLCSALKPVTVGMVSTAYIRFMVLPSS